MGHYTRMVGKWNYGVPPVGERVEEVGVFVDITSHSLTPNNSPPPSRDYVESLPEEVFRRINFGDTAKAIEFASQLLQPHHMADEIVVRRHCNVFRSDGRSFSTEQIVYAREF